MAKQIHIYTPSRSDAHYVVEMEDGTPTRGFTTRDEQTAYDIATQWNVRCSFGEGGPCDAVEMTEEELDDVLAQSKNSRLKPAWQYKGTLGRQAGNGPRAKMYAHRNILGVTCQDVAERFGVSVKSVRRWEQPGSEAAVAPAEVEEFISGGYELALALATAVCESAIEFLEDEGTYVSPARLPLYRSQEHYDAVHAGALPESELEHAHVNGGTYNDGGYGAGDKRGFKFANAISQTAAPMLYREGVPFEFYYPHVGDEPSIVFWYDGLKYATYGCEERYRTDELWGVWAVPFSCENEIWINGGGNETCPPLYLCKTEEEARAKGQELRDRNAQRVKDRLVGVFMVQYGNSSSLESFW